MSFSNLHHGLHPPGLQVGGNQRLLDWGCRVAGVTLSNQILWWLSEFLDLYVALQCHAEARCLLDSGDAEIIQNTSRVLSGSWCRCRSWSSLHSAWHPQESVPHSPRRQLSWPCPLMETEFCAFPWIAVLSPV